MKKKEILKWITENWAIILLIILILLLILSANPNLWKIIN